MLVPAAVAAQLASRRVLALVNGTACESRLATYSGKTYLGLRQSLLKQVGVLAGDPVHVVLRAADPPAAEPAPVGTLVELDAALAADPAFASAFAALPEGHREEYRRWLGSAGTEEERTARAARLRHRLVPDRAG